MIAAIKEKIISNATNILGWTTQRKIVVIESDDWGMIRMASRQAYEFFLKKGYPVDNCEYNRNDALESNEDIELLFETLSSVRDRNGNAAIITTNTILANPDFKKIKASGFQQYYYEPFTETLKHYPSHHRVYELYKEGIKNKLMLPQLHGREHVNVFNWMTALRNGERAALDAFDQNMFTISKEKHSNCKKEYLDGFGVYNEQQLIQLEPVISEASNLFENIFDFRSKSIIAPCYIWHQDAEQFFHNNGIRYIQGGRVQNIPQFSEGGYIHKRHYTGQRNKLKQIYLVRNAAFEPSSNPNLDWVDTCLKEIKNSFFWRKPAIISTHRLNFIGTIHSKNRSANLKLLRQLLTKIIINWPDVTFTTSDAAGDLISN